MVELYRKGQTLRDIADVFGCSMQNVHRRLQDCCEPMRPRGWRKRQPVFCMHYGQIIRDKRGRRRSEEHTSEHQSLMRTSYAVFCLIKTKQTIYKHNRTQINNTQL